MKFRKSSETTAEIDSELKSTAEKIDLEIVNAIGIAVDPRQDPNLEILYLRIKIGLILWLLVHLRLISVKAQFRLQWFFIFDFCRKKLTKICFCKPVRETKWCFVFLVSKFPVIIKLNCCSDLMESSHWLFKPFSSVTRFGDFCKFLAKKNKVQ